MTPTVGRIVHYQTHDEQPKAALIVRVNDDSTVNVRIFSAYTVEGDCVVEGVAFSDEPKLLHWSWPPRA